MSGVDRVELIYGVAEIVEIIVLTGVGCADVWSGTDI